jgi:hypothetical protein
MTSTVNNVQPIDVMHIASGDLWAGAEVQLYTLARTLQHIPGITVRVILFNHGTLERKLSSEGIDVSVFDETRLSSLQILRRILQSIHNQQPDVIHTHRLKENILGSLAACIAGRVPSMRTAHGAPEHHASWRQFHKRSIRALDRLSARFFQRRIIAVSDDLAALLRQSFPAEKIRTIENGIDFDSLPTEAGKSIANRDNGNNPLRIGLAGRLVPIPGYTPNSTYSEMARCAANWNHSAGS